MEIAIVTGVVALVLGSLTFGVAVWLGRVGVFAPLITWIWGFMSLALVPVWKNRRSAT